ncbi:MAG: TfoX/Sxy family protein [Acidimicrobiales bacterium]|nr:TfoX/Sxy family protein [Acidimicrobiia bacterium]NNF53675.1 TfoX/Sxy family protein [Acidimicrobiales bacterium]
MGFDDELARRVRELLADTPALTEKKMFGGLAFLVDRYMALAISGQGGLMVRVDTDASQELVDTTAARFAEMRGRQMQGWLRLDSEALQTDSELANWVNRGVKFAQALPPKT